MYLIEKTIKEFRRETVQIIMKLDIVKIETSKDFDKIEVYSEKTKRLNNLNNTKLLAKANKLLRSAYHGLQVTGNGKQLFRYWLDILMEFEDKLKEKNNK